MNRERRRNIRRAGTSPLRAPDPSDEESAEKRIAERERRRRQRASIGLADSAPYLEPPPFLKEQEVIPENPEVAMEKQGSLKEKEDSLKEKEDLIAQKERELKSREE